MLVGRKCRAATAPFSLLKRTSLSKGSDQSGIVFSGADKIFEQGMRVKRF